MRKDLQELLASLPPSDRPELRRSRGQAFERVCCWFLQNEPTYRAQLKKVWLWDEWPERWGDEAGIDLVAEAHDGSLWAIQAKAYDPQYSVTKADIDSFLSESSRHEFSYRLLIATTNRLARLAQRTIDAQEKPVGQLLLYDLERAEVSWPQSIDDLGRSTVARYSPRPHQREAIDAVVSGFQESDRGQLIMACGTGKTLTSLWINEKLGSQRTLVFVPSLSLLKQTIKEWLAHAAQPSEFLPVCSDDTVRGADQMVSHVAELGFPATGEAEVVAEFIQRPGPRVVFSTYQSSPVIVEAMSAPKVPEFDLVIADEAHRCAGPVSSLFANVLDAEAIRADKRLFMTATPRVFTGKIIRSGIDADFEIASMDDEARFGPVLHRLTFGEAIHRDPPLLSDYRVVIIGVDDETYRAYAEQGRFVTRDGEEVTDARSLAAQIGLAKAMRDYDLRRTISFHSRVKGAKDFARSFADVVAWIPEHDRPTGLLWSGHVSGKMNASQRGKHLDRLEQLDYDERGLLANARCLAEGVDVPTLDCVAFIDPKRSEIDIVQAVGRAIRKADNKSLGTVVIPVFVDASEDADEALRGSAFKQIWGVLRALRDHDTVLGEQLDALRRNMGRASSGEVQLPHKIVIHLPERVGVDFIGAFKTQLVEGTTASWEFLFGLLEEFVAREGHTRVPQRYATGDGYKLGSWVIRQRQDWAEKRPSADRVERLEALPDWSWDLLAEQWEAGFAHLSEFVARRGHARVPHRYETNNGYKLGHWTQLQRRSWKRKTLSADRVERLEALPDWSWDLLAEQWEAGFAHLSEFVARRGNTRVPNGFKTNDGFRLGLWIRRQSRSWLEKELSAQRIERLEALKGWSWAAFPDQYWEAGFAHLSEFVAREGHARVPHRYETSDGYKLGKWVGNQRGRKNRISAEKIKRLEALPEWAWRVGK